MPYPLSGDMILVCNMIFCCFFRLEDIEGIEGQRLRRVSTTDESSEEEEELTEEEKGL